MLIHKCRSCGFQTKLFDDWFNHLWGKQHQDVSRSSFLNWSDEDNHKSLLITTGVQVPPPLPSEILKIFLKHSCLIVDLVCWTQQPRKFVIQFQQGDDVDKVLKLSQPDQLSIGGHKIWLQKKNEVHDVYWEELMLQTTENGDVTARKGTLMIELSDSDGSDDNNAVNGKTVVEEVVVEEVEEDMDCDENPSSRTKNGATTENQDESSDDEDPDYSVEYITDMSADFRTVFLEKTKRKDDRKKDIKKNLIKLGSLWLDVFISFNNKLWPCCFMVSNKVTRTNRSEIGFEAVFICEVLKSARTQWLCVVSESKKEQRLVAKSQLKSFLKVLLNEETCKKRLDSLSKLKSSEEQSKKPLLKFKCHMIVTYSDKGDAKATMSFEKIEGRKKIGKMNTIIELFKLSFAEFEKTQINEWSPTKKSSKGTDDNNEVKEEDKEARKWTELEIVTVE